MRTDVKVGLICVFAIVLLVVIYFVFQGSKKGNPALADAGKASTAVASNRTVGTPSTTQPSASPAESTALTAEAPSEPAAPALATPPAAAAATPAGDPPTLLAQAGPNDFGRGIVPPPSAPSSPTSSGGPAFTPAGPGSPSGPSSSGTPSFGGPSSTPLSGGTPGLGGGTPMIPAVTPTTRPSVEGAVTLEPTRSGNAPARPLPTPGSTGSSFGGRPGSALSGAIANNTGSAAPTSPSFGSGSSFGGSTPAFGATGTTTGGTTHVVQKGDMLTLIAKKYNVSVKAIEAANPGVDPNRLKVKSTLKIPATATGVAGTPTAAPTFGGAPTLAPSTPSLTLAGSTGATTRPSGRNVSNGTTATNGAAPRIKPGTTYTIRKGDSLASIAQAAYGSKTAWRRIYRANRSELSDANTIPAGVTIRVPQ